MDKSEERFLKIINSVNSMSEEKMEHLCFEASDEEFEKEIEKLKNQSN